MTLELRLNKKLEGFGWKMKRGRHVMAQSARPYPTYRALRLSLIGLLKSIQANNFLVYDDTEDAPKRITRKRK